MFIFDVFIGFALQGEVLFFGHQRKVPKRKVAPRLARKSGYPVLLAKTGARLTRELADARFAQTGGALPPVFTAMLGGAKGVERQTPNRY